MKLKIIVIMHQNIHVCHKQMNLHTKLDSFLIWLSCILQNDKYAQLKPDNKTLPCHAISRVYPTVSLLMIH